MRRGQGVSKDGTDAVASHFPARPGSGSLTARCVASGDVVRVADVLAEPNYPMAGAARTANFRSVLGVPMKRGGEVVGVIMLARAAVGFFGEHEVDLLKTFADQAVIAIENVRLFNETREALERQTATAEVLEVIGNSVTDPQPVFDTILDSCQHCSRRPARHLFGRGRRLWCIWLRGRRSALDGVPSHPAAADRGHDHRPRGDRPSAASTSPTAPR